ncbi:hypothetical protein DOY81_007155, partial [Sarcophaga bullata]
LRFKASKLGIKILENNYDNKKMFKFMFLIALSVGTIQYTSAVCNQCHEISGVACKSETEFHPCVKGVPDTTQTFSCLEPDHVCTSKGPICISKVDNPQISPACGDTSKCGQCDTVDNGKYTCTSRTTFTMCFDGELSDIRVSCPEKHICDVAKAKTGENPCVLYCKEPEIEICDLDHPIDMPVTTTTEAPTTTTQVPTTTTPHTPPITTTPAPVSTTTTTELPTTTVPITTTTAGAITTTTTEATPPPTTTTTKPTTTTTESVATTTTTEKISTTTIISPTPTTTKEPTTTPTLPPTTTTENPANIVCSQQTAVGRYPYPNDTTCRNYIYCFRKGGQMQTTFLTCPNGMYFNPSTRLCGAAQPEGCV